jgi:phenylacetic acid degradation operon negative regulatory protein
VLDDVPVDPAPAVGNIEPQLSAKTAFPSARSMLFAILGGLVFADPEPVWTASLLYVMNRGGFSEQTARQAIARASTAGWITGERSGRDTRWTLGPALIPVFERGPERVFGFSSEPSEWDGRWLVLIISVPHEHRSVRKKLYGALQWAGLGNPTPGVWLTPHVDRGAEVERVIDELGLRSSALSFVGGPAEIGLSEAEIIDRAWDLERVAATYRELLDRFSEIEVEQGDEVLLAHLELTSALSHFPFMDPQLPVALVPDWIGREATRRLRALTAAWSPAAHSRWHAVVETTAPR